MAIKLSTGLRNKLLDTGSLKSIFASGFLKIYGGSVPASADAAAIGTLICTISVSSTGTGTTLATSASAGAIPKNSSETWSGVNGVGMAPTHYRHVAAGDTGGSSTTEARIQGTAGTSGTDLIFAASPLVIAETTTIDSYSITMPEL